MKQVGMIALVYKEKDATEALKCLLDIINAKYQPGWTATLSIFFECSGHYHTTPQEEIGKS